jgi:hypothetical protein
MKRHLTPSLVISLIALFVALGGSSYAAVTLHANSVGSRQIKNGSIRIQDLNASIRPSSKNAKFRAAVVDTVNDPTTGLTIHVVSDPGPQGAQGPQGATGPATVTTRDAIGPDVQGGQVSGTHVDCAAGEKVVGGGASFEGGDGSNIPKFSIPEGNGWSAAYTNVSQNTGPAFIGHTHVYVLCAGS